MHRRSLQVHLKFEDKNNRLVDQLFKSGSINDSQKKRLKASGSRPGIMFGLPKMHKEDIPLRPVLSTTGSFNYEMSRFMVSLLSPLTTNIFTICDSFSFVSEILKVRNDNYVMASFDVKSLFTNIPVVETSNIILEKLFPTSESVYEGFNKKQFSKMINNCTENNLFLFNNDAYIQLDGCPMGGCISPTLANIFLCHHETMWLEECPLAFKPVFYRRYVDDTFVLFREQSHIKLFLDYLNEKHQRIKFTVEIEKHGCLSFLDVLVSKIQSGFETNTFHKATDTGLGLKFDSAVSSRYKFNLIDCLLDRAYKINSNYKNLCSEFEKLRKFFCQNGYGLNLIENRISKKLNSIFVPEPIVSSVSKQIIHCKIPYMSNSFNKKFNSEILNLVSQFFPQVNLRLIFFNNNTVQSFFPYKDVIPKSMKSNIVYKYECGICHSTYYGESTRHFKTRIAEHSGFSSRTGLPLTSRIKSNIYGHFSKTGHEILPEYFEVVQSVKQRNELKIAESIDIHRFKPTLNEMVASVPLNILN